ncbi:MAG: zf-HC2 domain-containing protein [Bacteroidota bacterium]
MNDNRKATEFSTHLSRSQMRRYLHGQLNTEETRQVELHLAHCAHCSAALVNYIEEEEADQYNTYAKQLSGKLKEQKIIKRSSLSSFQVKTIRAAAAVLTLIVFSFFGVKNIINKEVNNYQSEETGLPVKGKPVVTTKKPTEKKLTTKPMEEKKDRRIAESRPVNKAGSRPREKPAIQPQAIVKKKASVKKDNTVATTPTVKPKVDNKKVATSESKRVPKTVSPKKEVQQPAKPDPVEVEESVKVEQVAKAVDNKPKTDSEEEAKVEPVKPLPQVKKMDAAKKVELSDPIGNTPSVLPVPGGRLR